MPVVDLDGDQIVVETEYRDRELIRQIPGVRWNTDRQAWTLPLAWGPCLQLRGVFGDRLKVTGALAGWSVAERQNRVDPCLELRTTEDGDAETIAANPELFPYQRAGVAFMVRAKRALNADEMGLGKSAQTIRTLEGIGNTAYPALIVCPNSMKWGWADEFGRWAPHRRTVVVTGSAAARRKAILSMNGDEPCPVHGDVNTFLSTQTASAGAAMSGNCENAIPSTQNGNERTHEGGHATREIDCTADASSVMAISDVSSGSLLESSSGSSSSKDTSALSADAISIGPASTMTIEPDKSEASFATSVTPASRERRKTRRGSTEPVCTCRPDVAIVNWETLRAHTRLCGYGSMTLTDSEKTEKELNTVSWSTVVADEAHRGKDPRTKQTRALWYIGDRVEHAFALTGTPVANSPEDLWALMRFVSPREFPVKSGWVDRYAIADWSPHGFKEVTGLKAETKDELFRVLDPRFIRRTKKAVLPQLPDKIYTERLIDLGSSQRKAYDQMRKHMLAELEGGVLLATSPLTKITRLLQLASASGRVEEEEVQCEDCAGAGCGPCGMSGKRVKQHLILTEPSCKVDALEEIASELGSQKAVVFTHSVQLARLCSARLEKLGYQHGAVTGDVTGWARQDSIKRFQESNLQFIVVTYGAGSEGITLTAAQTAIRLQRCPSFIQDTQAEDRVHRIGQTGTVQFIDVVSRDTMEPHIQKLLQKKEDRFEEIARDEESLKAWLA